MTLVQYVLIGVFLIATIVGYLLINNVPSRLHTPLMSGMNALSGITILGALIATGAALKSESVALGYIFGSLAIVLAMINVVGGFSVTSRMLRMFGEKKEGNENSTTKSG